MTIRRKAREGTLMYLYQTKLAPHAVTHSHHLFAKHFEIMEPEAAYFSILVEGVIAEQEVLDRQIEEAAEHWKLSRMEIVDLIIMRVATWELLSRPEISHQVIIDEAVEIAKIFGSEDSPAFVNGILDRIRKTVRADAKRELASDESLPLAQSASI